MKIEEISICPSVFKYSPTKKTKNPPFVHKAKSLYYIYLKNESKKNV